MTLQESAKVATATVEALKSQPLALALILINVLFLASGAWVLSYVADNARADRDARNALLSQMAENCRAVTTKGASP